MNAVHAIRQLGPDLVPQRTILRIFASGESVPRFVIYERFEEPWLHCYVGKSEDCIDQSAAFDLSQPGVSLRIAEPIELVDVLYDVREALQRTSD